ncbi:TetR/AcrR family transcriptional regulator [Nocardia vaccinii]|uniref:TetR/AcrR family transcriptional regulator n=1 Tax=Nocardia vaccinii TaxID=1822 RepID=UPI00082EE861|nr:TetR/AcrR family transcriptional regulator [Nocardia vaccinii]
MTVVSNATVWEGSSASAIYEAAIELWSANGYAGASLRDIAREVGLKVASLYNHIDSREELLVRIMRDNMNQLLSKSDAAVADVTDPMERLRRFMRAAIVYHAEHRREAFIGNSELRALSPENRAEIQQLRDEYERRLMDLLAEVDAAGVVEIPDIQMAAYAAVAIASHVSTWYRNDARLSIDEIADRLIAMYAPVSCPSKVAVPDESVNG